MTVDCEVPVSQGIDIARGTRRRMRIDVESRDVEASRETSCGVTSPADDVESPARRASACESEPGPPVTRDEAGRGNMPPAGRRMARGAV
jgi:hypothetical protein